MELDEFHLALKSPIFNCGLCRYWQVFEATCSIEDIWFGGNEGTITDNNDTSTASGGVNG
jgi:hypothetical protein